MEYVEFKEEMRSVLPKDIDSDILDTILKKVWSKYGHGIIAANIAMSQESEREERNMKFEQGALTTRPTRRNPSTLKNSLGYANLTTKAETKDSFFTV